MAPTDDIAGHPQESGKRTTHSLGDGIERAMADADKRLSHLVDKLHHAARGSDAYTGAERDVKRVLGWFEAKAHELESELRKLANHPSEPGPNPAPRGEPQSEEGDLEGETAVGPDVATTGG